MTTIPQQIQTLSNKITSLRALINGVRNQGLLYSVTGDFSVYGCKVTQGTSATDMYLALDGAVTGDEPHLNPDIVSPAVRHEEYPNIAVIYGEVFEMENVNKADTSDDSLLLEAAPGTADYGRYDIVYAYVGQAGPAIAIATGTASATAKTHFVANGLDTSAYPSATTFDPTLPHGTLPIARVYVQTGDTGIANARIADLRDFNGRLAGEDAYVYVAYASADDGTGFTTTFNAALDYIAIKSTNTEITSPAVGDFTGLWKNYKGATGATGADGDDAYTYIAYASDDTGTDFTNTFNAALDYIAIKATTAPLSPPIVSDFTGLWKNYKGATGSTGAAGADGDDAYVYIAYASDDTGTDFTNTFSASLDYIAVRATTAPLSPPIVSDFTGLWKNYKGATGTTGATGAQGDKGGIRFNFSSNTATSDPTAGIFKFNNATIGSVTEIYVDSLAQAAADVSAYITTWAAGGTIIVSSNTNADTSFGIFTVTSVTDNTGWFTISVTFVSGAGFTDAEACTLVYLAKGATGGGGDFSSNTAVSVDGEIVLFSGIGGKTGKRSTSTGLLKATAGVLSAATARTDYAEPTTALATGLLKNTTTTGEHTIATAGTDYVAPGTATTFTATQTMNGKPIVYANSSVAAHATTMDPWVGGNYVTLTGTATTFTALANAPQAGAEVELYMNAAHVFTDGIVFEVDGNANYTATIGDRVLLRAKSTTVFTVHPRKADGTSIVVSSSSSSGGATETTSAVDITLTSASTRVQAVTMTADGKAVILPDATTLTEGGELFAISNAGDYSFFVTASGGGVIAMVDVGATVMLYLKDNSTTAGSWATAYSGFGDCLLFGPSTVSSTIQYPVDLDITAMSTTQAIVVFSDYAAGYLKACTLNVDGTTLIFGAVLTVNAVSSVYCSVTSMSATQAIVTYRGTSTYLQACTLNVDGTTLTNGAVLTVNAVQSDYCSVTSMSATQAIVTYRGTSTYLQACTLNVDGTTLTNGAVLTVNAVSSLYMSITTLSSTQAIVAYQGTSSYLQACTLNVNGTTLTNGAILQVNGVTTNNSIQAVALGTTTAIAASINASTMTACRLTVSGTTLAKGDAFTLQTTSGQLLVLERLAANKFVWATVSGTNGTACKIGSVLGTNLSVGDKASGPVRAAEARLGFAALSAHSAVCYFRDADGYLNVALAEVTV